VKSNILARVAKNVNKISDVAVLFKAEASVTVQRDIQRSVMTVSDIDRSIAELKGIGGYLHVMEQRSVASPCLHLNECGVLPLRLGPGRETKCQN